MASAFGKLILLGEHAVVHGCPALVAGLQRGATASATADEGQRLQLGDRSCHRGDGSDLGQAYDSLLTSMGRSGISVEVSPELPLGVGLGGSAAISVAIARALLELDASPPEEPRTAQDSQQVFEASMAWERIFHGDPSGVDSAAATFGGCLRYVRGESPESVKNAVPLVIAVAVAGPAAETKTMVEQVAKLKSQSPDKFQKTLEAIHALVDNAQLALQAGDLSGLGQLLNYNQMLLAGWLLSTPEIEHAVALARDAGALGAKLTGAGGGGCVLALAGDRADAIMNSWKNEGLECFLSKVPASIGATTPGGISA
ncbi:MAG: mevalonate kinase [Polyangiaceae bacterium]|nr:mevalonate kinase [Polyangiaceae bacterium]